MKILSHLFYSFACVSSALAHGSLVDFKQLVASDKHEEVSVLLKDNEIREQIVNITQLSVRSAEMLKVLQAAVGARILSDQDDDGMNLLLIAAQNSQLDQVRLLLAEGADVNYKDQYGRTALYFSVGNTSAECVNILIEAGAYVNCQNSDGVTPLIFAVREGNVQAVKALLSAGANKFLRDGAGKAALSYAASGPDVDYVSVETMTKIKSLLLEDKSERHKPTKAR